MKQLSIYINEKLVLNKDTFKTKYNYFPNTTKELKEIIEQLLEERKDNDVIYLNDIDTSEITNMSKLFYNNDNIIKIDISNWNISKVTDMFAMFKFCKNLKSVGDLSKWNLSKVESIEETFNRCENLKSIGDISGWNVSKVKYMSYTFFDCKNLESIGDLSNWNVSKVEDMEGMFEYCNSLKNVGDLNKWKVNKNTNIRAMFLFSVINYPEWYK